MGGRGITFNSTANPVRVMVVDDHPALRAGLRSLIDSDPALRVLLEVGRAKRPTPNTVRSVQTP